MRQSESTFEALSGDGFEKGAESKKTLFKTMIYKYIDNEGNSNEFKLIIMHSPFRYRRRYKAPFRNEIFNSIKTEISNYN